jgi:tetratricopeptide (TPR) repeat protein
MAHPGFMHRLSVSARPSAHPSLDNTTHSSDTPINDSHSPEFQMGSMVSESSVNREREFAEPIPEYLRPGYRSLMAGDGFTAIALWEKLYDRYPSAEICGHLARAHYYLIYFLNHEHDPARHAEHVAEMRLWAERALTLNPNSSTGHAMLAGAIGRQAQISGSQKQIIANAWQVQYHAERAVLTDNNWIGHYVLGVWNRELASVGRGIRTLIQLLQWRLPHGSYEESITHLREILKQYPDNNTIYAELGYTYEAMGDLEQARHMLEQSLAMPLFRHPIAPHLTRRAANRLAKVVKKLGR